MFEKFIIRGSFDDDNERINRMIVLNFEEKAIALLNIDFSIFAYYLDRALEETVLTVKDFYDDKNKVFLKPYLKTLSGNTEDYLFTKVRKGLADDDVWDSEPEYQVVLNCTNPKNLNKFLNNEETLKMAENYGCKIFLL